MDDSQYQEDLLEFLQNNRVFHGLHDMELLELLPLIKEQCYYAGEYISHEGDIAEQLYIIKKGEVLILKENPLTSMEHELACLGPSDTIGEISLIENSPHAARSASIKAKTNTELIVFRYEDLQPDKIDRNTYNALLVNLARLLCQRLRISNEKNTYE